jgi:hypothetical protein
VFVYPGVLDHLSPRLVERVRQVGHPILRRQHPVRQTPNLRRLVVTDQRDPIKLTPPVRQIPLLIRQRRLVLGVVRLRHTTRVPRLHRRAIERLPRLGQLVLDGFADATSLVKFFRHTIDRHGGALDLLLM